MTCSASVHPYRLPLTEPVVWGGTPHATRDGLLLRVETTDGLVGWGDAAPLPGFSRETLAETRDALRRAVAHLADADLGDLPPAARFAAELALADLDAQASGRSLPDALADAPVAARLPLAGLLLGGDASARAAALAAAGYTTVKLKVGRASVADDAATVRAVRRALGPNAALRLDANRAWSADDARRFADAIAGVEIAFIEEPLADADGLDALARDTSLPVALDESLQVPGATVPPWAAAAVLKPTLVGGVAATLRLAREARALGVPVVLSAAFESGVGVRGVAALALATGAAPAGLDPYRWLAADVFADRLPLDRPLADTAALFASREVVTP